MLGKVIYFDAKKFNDYFAIVTGNKIAEMDNVLHVAQLKQVQTFTDKDIPTIKAEETSRT